MELLNVINGDKFAAKPRPLQGARTSARRRVVVGGGWGDDIFALAVVALFLLCWYVCPCLFTVNSAVRGGTGGI